MDFDSEWVKYPKKEGRKYAAQCWQRLSAAERQRAADALPQHVKKWSLEGRAKQFIPDFSSWLNQARFDDEVEMPQPVASQWWATEQSTLAAGAKLGVNARAGESLQEYRSRVGAAMKVA